MRRTKVTDLTERELLLLLNEKVDRLENEVVAHRANAEKIQQLEMRILKQEVQLRTWGAIIGFIAGIGGSFITKLLNLQ